ncbi:MAG: hypothetical protein HY790_05695 [Deltaproteobacteria bacterium]|nr:hypothetical protein [Deltaproteobacteria bacterium]
MKKLLIIAAVLLFFLLPGASCFGEPAESYYPLKEGMTWVYSISSNKPGAQKITVTNLAPRELQGKSVTPRKWEVVGGVKYYFIAKDDSGVYRYAEQKGETGEPQIITPKVYYLKNPVDVGTTWDTTTKMGEDDLKVNITVESIGEKVQVPAGTYKNCVKLKHEGKVSKEGGGAALSLTAYEWYAAEVGLVKSMFTAKQSIKGKAEAADSITHQLESFKP